MKQGMGQNWIGGGASRANRAYRHSITTVYQAMKFYQLRLWPGEHKTWTGSTGTQHCQFFPNFGKLPSGIHQILSQIPRPHLGFLTRSVGSRRAFSSSLYPESDHFGIDGCADARCDLGFPQTVPAAAQEPTKATQPLGAARHCTGRFRPLAARFLPRGNQGRLSRFGGLDRFGTHRRRLLLHRPDNGTPFAFSASAMASVSRSASACRFSACHSARVRRRFPGPSRVIPQGWATLAW